MTEEKLKNKVEELAEGKQKNEPIKQEETISEALRLRQENDEYEKELLRKEELRARAQLGGRADAGQREPTPQEEADEKAKAILKMFQ